MTHPIGGNMDATADYLRKRIRILAALCDRIELLAGQPETACQDADVTAGWLRLVATTRRLMPRWEKILAGYRPSHGSLEGIKSAINAAIAGATEQTIRMSDCVRKIREAYAELQRDLAAVKKSPPTT